MRSLAALVGAGALAGAAAASFCDPTPEWQPVWSDEFDGDTLNASNWKPIVGPDVGSCRTAYCQPENVAVANGTLILTSQREQVDGYNFTSGAVRSMGLQHWAYSPVFRLCASARLPGNAKAANITGENQGIWPAIWMMPDPNASVKQCWPDLGEVDILEMINGDGFAHGTYHWESSYPAKPCSEPVGHLSWTAQRLMPNDWDTAFHEYAVERGPNYVAYVYDGVVLANTTGTAAGVPPTGSAAQAAAAGSSVEAPEGSAANAPTPLYWDVPFYCILNTAIGGPWPGPASNKTKLPVQHVVDYVRVVARPA